ncbi:hypothetical protein V6N12_024093 [Hibiscus sabdariffa]|uniref:Uncharacterized protein n=1 Tax=Hibiscus sabdariffa TaxID=183260 RepID=A0ABR2FZT2_9ROSI
MGPFDTDGGRPSDGVSGVGIPSTEHRGPEDVTAQQGVGVGKESSGLDELVAKTASQGKASYASVTARAGRLRDANACNLRKEDVVVLEDDFVISQSGLVAVM